MNPALRTWILAVIAFAAVWWYFTPALAALYHWTCAKRDEMALRAKLTKRERRNYR